MPCLFLVGKGVRMGGEGVEEGGEGVEVALALADMVGELFAGSECEADGIVMADDVGVEP